MKDMIFLLMFLPLIILALKNPFLGLCGWIWTIMAIPTNMLWGFSSDIRFTYILASATILGMFFDKDPLRKPPFHSIFILMLLFLIQTAISNLTTLGISEISWTVWNDFFKAVLFSGLIIMLLTTKNRIKTFLFALLLGVGFNIFFEGLKFLVTLGSYKIIGIENSMMTDNNLFALAILLVLPLYFYIIPEVKQKYLKLGFAGLAGLSAISVIGSFSRGGFIGLIIVSWEVFKKLRLKNKLLFIVFGALIYSSAVYVASDKWEDRMDTIENAAEDLSLLGRITAWKLATVAAIENPLLGTGQDSMQNHQVWRYFYHDIEKMDFITTKNVSPDYGKAAHSIYFQVLGDTGFLGLLLFLLILSKSWFLSKKINKKYPDTWQGNLGGAINTSLVVFMISGGLLSMAYYDLVYVLIAITISLSRTVQEKEPN